MRRGFEEPPTCESFVLDVLAALFSITVASSEHLKSAMSVFAGSNYGECYQGIARPTFSKAMSKWNTVRVKQLELICLDVCCLPYSTHTARGTKWRELIGKKNQIMI